MKNHRIILIVLSLAVLLTLLFAAQLGVSAAEPGLPVAQEDVLLQQQTDGVAIGGQCGTSDVYWTFNADTGVLSIHGTGEMPDYSLRNLAPWFTSSDSIKKIYVGEGVTKIGVYAFLGCTEAVYFEISKTVTSIDEDAYPLRNSLTTIVVSSENPNYCSVSNVLFNKSKTTLLMYPAGSTSTSYSVPSGVKTISSSAFYSCKSLKTVKFPDTLRTIRQGAFEGCSSLANLELPSGVTSMGNYAFKDCSALFLVSLPGTLRSIGNRVFEGCTNLYMVAFEGRYTEWNNVSIGIDNDELDNVPILLWGQCDDNKAVGWSFNLSDNNLLISGEGAMPDFETYNDDSTAPWSDCKDRIKTVVVSKGITEIGEYSFYKCKEITSVELPQGLKIIDIWAFNSCSKLTSVTIPDGVTSIYANAFSLCTSLKDISIPDSVTDLGAYAFSGCTSLESVKISSKISEIMHHTFLSCTSLDRISIPKSVKEISSAAFLNCDKLKTVYYKGTAADWGKISIAEYNQPILDATKHFVLGAVTGLRQSNHGSDFISLSWNSVEGATGYYIYRIIDGKWKKIATVSTTTAKITKLAPGASYKFKVSSVQGAVEYEFSDVVSAHTGPSAMTGKVSVNRQDSEMIRLQWDKINNADGYMIYWYVNGKLTKLAATLNTAYSITKLNSDTKYTFKVRGYRKVDNGIYVGGYSADFVTWTGPNPTTGTAVAKTKSATLSWNAVKGATKYYIYVYTEATGYYTCVCSTTATSKTITGLKSGQAYYYRVKACKVNDGVNYYSSYSNVMFARAK